MPCNDPVTNFVIFRFRNNVPRYQFVRVFERALRDNAVRFVVGHTWQVEQVFAGRIVDIDGLIAAHAFLHALGHGLGITPDGLRGMSRALPDFVRIVFAGSAGRDRSEQ